jgi:hypothetical protein
MTMLALGHALCGPYWTSLRTGHRRIECWIVPVASAECALYEVIEIESGVLSYSRRHDSIASARRDADQRLLGLVTRSPLQLH